MAQHRTSERCRRGQFEDVNITSLSQLFIVRIDILNVNTPPPLPNSNALPWRSRFRCHFSPDPTLASTNLGVWEGGGGV